MAYVDGLLEAPDRTVFTTCPDATSQSRCFLTPSVLIPVAFTTIG